jgi:hypothetical protein
MDTFISKKLGNISDEFAIELIKNQNIFYELYDVCGQSFNRKHGSYLFNGKEYEYYFPMYNKQKLMFDKIKSANKALEIGTYMGHSLLIMLIANPKLKITTIDIDPRYSKPATDYLKTKFPEADINFICGSSLDVLPTITEKFDFFHIDGRHNNDMITTEFEFCYNLKETNSIQFIFDDAETCQPLLENIRKNFKVLEEIKPDSEWYNTYMHLG